MKTEAGTEKARLLVQTLAGRGLTLALAESCTGGAIADKITNIPGASCVLIGGVVAYTAIAKINLLGLIGNELPPGCVGSRLSEDMAIGIQNILKTNLALAITGALGPDSPSPHVEVGEVHIAVVGLGRKGTWRFKFAGDRQTIKEAAVRAALDALFEFIAG